MKQIFYISIQSNRRERTWTKAHSHFPVARMSFPFTEKWSSIPQFYGIVKVLASVILAVGKSRQEVQARVIYAERPAVLDKSTGYLKRRLLSNSFLLFLSGFSSVMASWFCSGGNRTQNLDMLGKTSVLHLQTLNSLLWGSLMICMFSRTIIDSTVCRFFNFKYWILVKLYNFLDSQ